MNILTTSIAATSAFLFIAIGAWIARPVEANPLHRQRPPETPPPTSYTQLQTTAAHVYPYVASTGRTTFVEMVE